MEIKPQNFLALVRLEQQSGIPSDAEKDNLARAVQKYVETYPNEGLRDTFMTRMRAISGTAEKARAVAPFVFEINGRRYVMAVKNPDALREMLDSVRNQAINKSVFAKEEELRKQPFLADKQTAEQESDDINKGEKKLQDIQLKKETDLSLIEMRRSALYGKLANDISSVALVSGYIRNRNDARHSKTERLKLANKKRGLGARISRSSQAAAAAAAAALLAVKKHKKSEKEEALKQKAISAEKRNEEGEINAKAQREREVFTALYIKAMRERGYTAKG